MTATVQALYDAADDDSATGGPDVTRRIFPVVAVITAAGYRRLPDDEVAADRRPGDRRPDAASRRPGRGPHLRKAPSTDEHAVLRLARAADEGPGGLRAQGHRARPQRGRAAVRRRHPVRLGEPVQALHKVSEIYDRIAFAAVGRYNEFENLRIAGVRLADMRGYAYDRRDVTGRGLANAYAQTLGTIFSSGGEKPYEVEIFVAEVGDTRRRRPDLPAHLRRPGGRRARLRGDGRLGGHRVEVPLRRGYAEGMTLQDAVRLAVDALGHNESEPRTIPPENLEVAVLDRTRSQQRKFKRLSPQELANILSQREPAGAAASAAGSQGSSGSSAGPSTGPSLPDEPSGSSRTDESSGTSRTDESGEPPIAPPSDPGDSLT